jgi:hypothetical protein
MQNDYRTHQNILMLLMGQNAIQTVDGAIHHDFPKITMSIEEIPNIRGRTQYNVTVRNIKHRFAHVIRPFVSVMLATIRAQPTTTAPSNCVMLFAIGTVVDKITCVLIIATKHLLCFFYLNITKMLTMKEFEDVPIIICLEDVLHRRW